MSNQCAAHLLICVRFTALSSVPDEHPWTSSLTRRQLLHAGFLNFKFNQMNRFAFLEFDSFWINNTHFSSNRCLIMVLQLNRITNKWIRLFFEVPNPMSCWQRAHCSLRTMWVPFSHFIWDSVILCCSAFYISIKTSNIEVLVCYWLYVTVLPRR